MSGNAIKKNGNYSFYNLKNLVTLNLKLNPLEFISSNAFNFKYHFNGLLNLYLNDIKPLNGSSFDTNSVNNFKRWTNIWIGNNLNLKYFDDTIFRPFLEANPNNTATFFDKLNLDCNEC